MITRQTINLNFNLSLNKNFFGLKINANRSNEQNDRTQPWTSGIRIKSEEYILQFVSFIFIKDGIIANGKIATSVIFNNEFREYGEGYKI